MAEGAFDPNIAAMQMTGAQTAAEVTQANLAQGAVSGTADVNATKATFSSMGDFQARYPEFYKLFMHSWAMQAVSKANRDNERLLAEMKKANRR